MSRPHYGFLSKPIGCIKIVSKSHAQGTRSYQVGAYIWSGICLCSSRIFLSGLEVSDGLSAMPHYSLLSQSQLAHDAEGTGSTPETLRMDVKDCLKSKLGQTVETFIIFFCFISLCFSRILTLLQIFQLFQLVG